MIAKVDLSHETAVAEFDRAHVSLVMDDSGEDGDPIHVRWGDGKYIHINRETMEVTDGRYDYRYIEAFQLVALYFKKRGEALVQVRQARVFDKHDWEGFAGAEAWFTNGIPTEAEKLACRPVLREFGGCVMVADRTGVQYLIPTETSGIWIMPGVTFASQAAALAFLNGIPEQFDLDEFGFVEST